MAAHEWRILSDIIRAKNWYPVVKAQLTGKDFSDGEARKIFEFLRVHYYNTATLHQLPTLGSVRRRFPGFKMTDRGGEDDGALETLIWELKLNVLGNELRGIAEAVTDICDSDDPETALTSLKSMVGGLSYRHNRRGAAGIKDVIEYAKQAYEDAQSGISHGIPWPWECLTYDTMGKRPCNFVIIYARHKQMKTWIQLKSALDDFMVHRRRVLFWSREMGKEDLFPRVASLLGKVDYQLVEHGELPPHKYVEYMRALEGVEEMFTKLDLESEERRKTHLEDFRLLIGRDAPRTLSEIRAAVDLYEPDIVYLDSYYHLDAEKGGRTDAERQRYLCEAIKQMAIDYEIPFIVTAQANKEGEKRFGDTTVDIGRTDASGAEADLIIRIIKRKVREIYEDDYEGYWEREAKSQQRRMTKRAALVRTRPGTKPNGTPTTAFGMIKPPSKPRIAAELAIMISGSRRGTMDGFLIRCIPGYEFSVLREDITPTEVRKWLQEDAEAEKEESAGRPQRAAQKAKSSYKTNPNAMTGMIKRGSGLNVKHKARKEDE